MTPWETYLQNKKEKRKEKRKEKEAANNKWERIWFILRFDWEARWQYSNELAIRFIPIKFWGIRFKWENFFLNPFHPYDLIINSPYCLTYNSCNVTLEYLVLDQIVIP